MPTTVELTRLQSTLSDPIRNADIQTGKLITALVTYASELASDATALTTRVTNAETAATALTTRVTTLETALTALTARVTALETP